MNTNSYNNVSVVAPISYWSVTTTNNKPYAYNYNVSTTKKDYSEY